MNRDGLPHWVQVPAILKTYSPAAKFLICLKLHWAHRTTDMTLLGVMKGMAYPRLARVMENMTKPKANTVTERYRRAVWDFPSSNNLTPSERVVTPIMTRIRE